MTEEASSTLVNNPDGNLQQEKMDTEGNTNTIDMDEITKCSITSHISEICDEPRPWSIPTRRNTKRRATADTISQQKQPRFNKIELKNAYSALSDVESDGSDDEAAGEKQKDTTTRSDRRLPPIIIHGKASDSKQLIETLQLQIKKASMLSIQQITSTSTSKTPLSGRK